jgi:RHS repeat-associated protein
VSASAQTTTTTTTSATDSKTPLGLQPGQPAGSYALSGFDTVNPYNGNLNFHLPLLGIGGRGSAQMKMMLAIDSKGWRVKHKQVVVRPETSCEPTTGCGDPETTDYYWATPNRWSPDPGFGPGILFGRWGGEGTVSCNPGGSRYLKTVTRLTFVASDGTEYELRDQLYGGEPKSYSACTSSFGSRGTVFITADGTAATFISDEPISDNGLIPNEVSLTTFYPSGYLMLKDGTRYRIDSGNVTWMRDRNGNLLSFTYTNGALTKITDSLNREVTIASTTEANYGNCTKITYRGFGSAARTIRVCYDQLGNLLRSGYTLKTYLQLFPEAQNSSTTTYNPSKVSHVWLPDGRKYDFLYNSYGELAKVVLPTGGGMEYDYTVGSGYLGEPEMAIYRRVIARRVYKDTGVLEHKTSYSDPVVTYPCNPVTIYCLPESVVTVDHRTSANVLLAREKHYFYGSVQDSFSNQGAYSGWQEGKEFKTEQLDTDGLTVLRSVENTYQQRASVSWWTQNSLQKFEPPLDVRLTQTQTTLSDTNQVSKQTYSYDQYNNQTDVYEYDYGSGAAGTFKRRTHTDYLTSNTIGGVVFDYDSLVPDATNPNLSSTVHLRNLPTEQWVSSDAGGTQKKAITTYEYDNYTADVTNEHEPLVARTGISGLDSSFTTAKKTRGNVTAITRRLIQEARDIVTYQQYDVAGNVIKTIDANGAATTFTYTDTFGSPSDNEARTNTQPSLWLGAEHTFAFVTQAKNALNQIVYTQYDYYLGKGVNAEDVNGTVYSGYYNDPLDRPTQAVSAANDLSNTIKSQTRFIYDDANRTISTTSDRSGYDDDLLKSEIVYDGLGRTVETRQYEDATNYITVNTYYDALGRAYKKTNPYRPGTTPVSTTTSFDALGRVISVKSPDNTYVYTDYSGSRVLVKDQAGKERISETNALGQLINVWEVTPSDTQTVSVSFTGHTEVTAGYLTSYTYDVLDNVTKVTQGAQTRTFTYDSLKRLTQAVNPESGTLKYEYDDDGNLTKKIDPRKVTVSPLVYLETSYTYDALNRVTAKSYNDNGATPNVLYKYDNQVLPSGAPNTTLFQRGESTGRLVSVTYGGTAAGTYYGYDGLGRVIERVQQTDAINYKVNATYNRAGAMTTETYPLVSGATVRRVVNHTFDDAGRLSSLSTAATTYAEGASVSNIQYMAHGALDNETYGNNLLHQIDYNTRLQPTSIKLGTSSAPASIVNLTYTYGGTSNNGNIITAGYVGGGLSYTQTFTYDALNRLETAQETKAGDLSWEQTFSYDRYGNRAEVINGSPNMTFTAANKIVGRSYDLAGNQLTDGNHSYTYDAENHIKSVDGDAAYVYDGEGQRVRKLVGENLRMVYGIGGGLIAEFDGASGSLKKEYIYGASGLAATIEPVVGTQYTTADHLGSPRIMTNSTGAVASRHDYQPFGEELFAGVGSRTIAQKYSNPTEGLRQRFTGKERDNETDLDYYGARYYASMQGRFTSCDPIKATREYIVNPQKWNLYIFASNSPLTLIDPTGESDEGEGGGKIISVYLNFTAHEANSGTYDNQGKWHQVKELAKPNWNELRSLAEANGYQLNVYTKENPINTSVGFAQDTQNSELTVVAGHVGLLADGEAYSIPFGTGEAKPGRTEWLGRELDSPEVNGRGVAVFGCKSIALPVEQILNFTGTNQEFVGVEGGSDNASSVPANQWAAYYFVESYITTKGNIGKAAEAAQRAYTNSPHRADQGDRVRRRVFKVTVTVTLL